MRFTRRLWRSVALGLCAMATATVAGAQVTHPTPAPLLHVSWGDAADSVIAQAGRSGWTFSHVDDDGDYAFRGSIGTVNAVAFATFSASRGLSRILISVVPHPFARVTYRQLVDTLKSQHGQARLGGENAEDAVAPTMLAAAAWHGVLLGLRRDGYITLIFMCPESSPKLPTPRGPLSSVMLTAP